MNQKPNTVQALLREATETEAGIWTKLVAYCKEQGNGCMILHDAASWSDRKWMVCVGIMNPPQQDSLLWSWQGDALILVPE